MEALATDTTQTVHENGMEDGRVAICLPVRTPKGDLVGLSMILADMKSVGDGVLERLASPQIRTIMQKIAVHLRGTVSKTGETGLVPVLDVTHESALALIPDTARHVVPSTAPPAAAAAASAGDRGDQPAARQAAGNKAPPTRVAPIATVAAAKPASAPAKSSKAAPSPAAVAGATGEPALTPEAIDDILEFELTPDLPPVDISKSAPSRNGGVGATAKRANGAAHAVAPVTNGVAGPEVATSDVGQITTPDVATLSPAFESSEEYMTAGPETSGGAAGANGATARNGAAGANGATAVNGAAGGHVPTLGAAGGNVPTLGAAPAGMGAGPTVVTGAPAGIGAVSTVAAAAPALSAAPVAARTAATASPSASATTTSSKALSGSTTTSRVLSSSDSAQLLLEVQPYAKLRAGGRSRRFELQVRTPNNRDTSRDSAALDAHALQRLLSWLSAHRGSWNLEPTSFTLNLSITTLEDERFPQNVASALKSHGIAPDTIGFEIAEPLCMQRRAQVERFINLCDKIGCFIVIDDFSMDSSVLPLLRSKAVRLVKIDPKLTGVALKDKLAQALVVAIAQAVRVLGIHCSAKRVESQSSLQWLTAIGCDFAQGSAVTQLQPLEALLSTAAELAKA